MPTLDGQLAGLSSANDALAAAAPALAQLYANQSAALAALAPTLAQLYANQSAALAAAAPALAQLYANQSDYANSIIEALGNQSSVWDALNNGMLSLPPLAEPSLPEGGFDGGFGGGSGEDEADYPEDEGEVDLGQFPFPDGFPNNFFDVVFGGAGLPPFALPPSGDFAGAPLPDGPFQGDLGALLEFFQSLFNSSSGGYFPDVPNFPDYLFPNLTDLLDSLEALPPLPPPGDLVPPGAGGQLDDETALPPLSQDVQDAVQDVIDGLQSLLDFLGLGSGGGRKLLQTTGASASPPPPARTHTGATLATPASGEFASPSSVEATGLSGFLFNVLNSSTTTTTTTTETVETPLGVVVTTETTTASPVANATTESVAVISSDLLAAIRNARGASAPAPAPVEDGQVDLSELSGFALFAALFPWVTPDLLEAIRYGHLGAVQYALNAGQSPNARGSRGRTALHAAVTAPAGPRKNRIVLELLESGADPTITDDDGALPVDAADGQLDPELYDLLANLTAELEGALDDLEADAPAPEPAEFDLELDFEIAFEGSAGQPSLGPALVDLELDVQGGNDGSVDVGNVFAPSVAPAALGGDAALDQNAGGDDGLLSNDAA